MKMCVNVITFELKINSGAAELSHLGFKLNKPQV